MNNNKAPGRTVYPVPISLALTFFWTAHYKVFYDLHVSAQLFSSSLVFSLRHF